MNNNENSLKDDGALFVDYWWSFVCNIISILCNLLSETNIPVSLYSAESAQSVQHESIKPLTYIGFKEVNHSGFGKQNN